MHKHVCVVNIPNRTISILSRVEAVQLTSSVSHSLNRVVTFTKANSNSRLVQTAKTINRGVLMVSREGGKRILERGWATSPDKT